MMRKLPVLTFDEYKLRPVEERDAELYRAWTAADPFHQGLAPEWWNETGHGVECYAVENEKGDVIMFYRVEMMARCFVQFNPGNETKPELRAQNRDALQKGVRFLAMALGMLGFHEMVFDSQNPPLRRFSEKRLGFRAVADMLTKRLPVRSTKDVQCDRRAD